VPFNGLRWVPKELRFANGLQQKADDRARSEVFLDRAVDVQFDELGGIQTRRSFNNFSSDIFGGGTLSNCRRIAVVNDELVVFTDTALYSWNAQLTKWVNRGAHLGVAIDLDYRFTTNGDQFIADRAELNGTIVYCWTEGTTTVWVAAIDKTTGAVLMAPTAVTGTTLVQARLVALSTKILFFFHNVGATTLSVRALDPADPATGLAAAATTISAAILSNFDVEKVPGADQAVGASMLNPDTSYLVWSVTAGLTVATSTKARTCNGRIAVAARPTGAHVHVFRTVSAGTTVRGDVITISGLVDGTVNQAIGTYSGSFNHLVAAFRSVQTAGQYVCVVFWNAGVDVTPNLTFVTKTNTVDDAGTIGTESTFVTAASIASRAFDRSGSVFINLLFDVQNSTPAGPGPELNTVYLLYREDRTIHGKAVQQAAGTIELLTVRPGVTSVDGRVYNWAGAVRRTIALAPDLGDSTLIGGGKAFIFGARSVVDITIEFDSDSARRVAQIGRTGYVSGAEILQYDGIRLVECGFNAFQYAINLLDAGAATGSMAAGTYSYKSTFSYVNGQGEVERSTTAAFASVVVAAGTSSTTSSGGIIGQLFTSRKPALTVDVWRTAVNQGMDAPFYLASSLDPNDTSNPNRYLPNTIAGIPTFTDALSDASLTTHAPSPENGDELESLAPPPARLIIATDTRVFLAGVAGDPDRVWYSQQRDDGEIARFHDALTFPVPRPGGDITAIIFLDQTLIVFRETAIYAFSGTGFNNNGQGNNFELLRTVSTDLGSASQEAVALTPLGLLFKARKGWHLLDPGGNPRYVGAAVSDYDSETIKATTHLESQHQVRILSGSRMIVWDYVAVTEASPLGQWFEWTVGSGVDAVNWQGVYTILTSTGPAQVRDSYTGADFGLDVETAWIKPADLLQGGVAVRALQPLGEYRSAHLLRSRISYNYNTTVVDDRVWTPSPTTVGGPLQFRHSPKRPKCQAIKLRLTAVTDLARALLLCDVAAGMNVATDGVRWSAALQAVAPGELGNSVTLTIVFVDGVTGTFSIDVRDHFSFASGAWAPATNTIGVLVTMTGTSRPTVLQLEDAITAGTALATVVIPDNPAKIVAASMIGTTRTNALTGGAFGSPTGEALKLTGLGLEVGVEAPLYNRLPASRKV
jgi:hypothetical protein